MRVIEGDREALEREALAALIFDEVRYDELKQQLFGRPRAQLRAIEPGETSSPLESAVPLP